MIQPAQNRIGLMFFSSFSLVFFGICWIIRTRGAVIGTTCSGLLIQCS